MNNLQYCLLALLVIMIAACGGDSTEKEAPEFKLTAAQGGVNYGGIFHYNEEEYFRDLFPLNVTETIGNRITTNVYEGLVTLSQDKLEIIPALAEKWDVSEDGKTYTFHLRKDVFFHDDPCFEGGKGRKMNAHDVKYSFDLLCSNIGNNEGFWVFKDRVLGADDHYEATGAENFPVGGVPGIQVVDDSTVQIILTKKFPDFIRLLVTPFTYIIPHEAYEKYTPKSLRTKAVGTGPFMLVKVQDNEAVLLRRNPNYWGKDANGNQLPYLDGIRLSFIKEKKSAILELEKKNLHMIYRLPLEMVDNILDESRTRLRPEYEEFQLQMASALSYQYYGFQNKTKPFDNLKLRQALNYAVDRQKIVDFVLKGMAVPAFHGVVPPAFKESNGYDTDRTKGFDFDPQKARTLLAEAGFPEGKGLDPITLQINSGGGRNNLVAEAIQNQLEETLGIKVGILQMPFAQHLETCETGKAQFWRAGWIADYTSPENFLRLYYGKSVPARLEEKSYLNTVRYISPKFDEYLEEGNQTMDKEKRFELYYKAEQQVIDDSPVMPLFFYKDARLLHEKVRNFPQNAMEYRTFREVYFGE